MRLANLVAAVNRRGVLRALISGPAVLAGTAPLTRLATAFAPSGPVASASSSRQEPDGTPATPLFLLETHVAGTAYYEAEELAATLAAGQTLTLRREPANAFDDLAIEVLTSTGAKLGYVPRRDNRPFARLLDGGVPVLAEISAVRPGEWDLVRMRVSMAGPGALAGTGKDVA